MLQKASVWLSQLGSGAQLSSPVDGRQDADNFVTNKVTLQDYTDYGDAAAMNLSAVWSCVRLLSSTIASLPLQVMRTSTNGVDEEDWDHPIYRLLADSPNADQTPMDFFEFMAASFELQGNAYSEIKRIGGRIVALGEPILPENMMVRRLGSGALEYRVAGGQSYGQDNILHIRGFGGCALGGLSTLAYAKRSLNLTNSIERSASAMFRNGVRSSGILTIDKALSVDQRREAEAALQAKYAGTINHGMPMLLDNGVKWQALSINPDDAQMLESRAFGIEEVCRWFSVPPHMIGHTSKATSWGTGLEQQTLGFIIFTLRGRLKKFEQSLTKQLLSPADRALGLKIKFDLRGLMRGDSKARSEFYQTALMNGYMTINEVRALEGLPPVEGGDVPRMQAQNVPITQAGVIAPSPEPEPPVAELAAPMPEIKVEVPVTIHFPKKGTERTVVTKHTKDGRIAEFERHEIEE